jgi:hypothetical protein
LGEGLSLDLLAQEGKQQEALHIGSPHIPQWPSYDMLLACVQRKPMPEILAVAQTVRPSEDPEANYLAAAHLAYCGQSGAALDLLRRAITGHYCSNPAVDSDPLFASVRASPEFADIRAAATACQNTFLAQRGRRH